MKKIIIFWFLFSLTFCSVFEREKRSNAQVAQGNPPPPTPPNNFDSNRVPEDAPDVFSEIDTYFGYLEKIDQIIEANLRGYEALSADQINSISNTPLEPCDVQDGLVNHIRFSNQRIQAAGDYPFDLEDDVPLIIRDDVLLNAHADYVYHNMHPLHLYISQSKCTEQAIANFHELLIRQSIRFRHSIDRMIEQRRLLSSIADVFGGETVLKALRSQIIRMFDEIFARRMGWGYHIKNPGHKFMVFIRHSQFVKKYIPSEENNNDNPTTRSPLNKRSTRQDCIVSVQSIDDLSHIMDSKPNHDFQIFHFKENEEKLKLKIENLRNTFDSWLKTIHGWFKTQYYTEKWHEIYVMFNAFEQEILKNPNYGSVLTKSEIIDDFKKVILEQMDYNLKWYYYPENGLSKIKGFIQKIYKYKYPLKPSQNQVPFHGEL